MTELTARQLEVARLSADHTNSEIAEQLGISVPTVKGHLNVVRLKLGVHKKRHIQRALAKEAP
jgi:DNA-binding CsgD family transcriptional regulator